MSVIPIVLGLVAAVPAARAEAPLAIRAALVSAVPAARAEAPLAIRAKEVWTGGGRVLADATVLIENGRIVAVGADIDVPAGAERLEHAGVLTAGLIALHGHSGAVGEVGDATRPALPEARVGVAVNAAHPDFARLNAAGITTVAVTPEAIGISGGTSALFKTHGGVVLRDPAQLSLVFSPAGLSGTREPTSLAGALGMLRELFREPEGVVAEARAGRLPCLFEVSGRDDVRRALAFAREFGLRGALHGAELSGELAAEIQEGKLAVILPVLVPGTARRSLDAVRQLAERDVTFGYGLDAPWNHPDALRISAALCVRAGLPRQAAWDGLTAGAARIAGVDTRVGRIERGLDADLVLWSGDPLDLASRTETVLVDGRATGASEGGQ